MSPSPSAQPRPHRTAQRRREPAPRTDGCGPFGRARRRALCRGYEPSAKRTLRLQRSGARLGGCAPADTTIPPKRTRTVPARPQAPKAPHRWPGEHRRDRRPAPDTPQDRMNRTRPADSSARAPHESTAPRFRAAGSLRPVDRPWPAPGHRSRSLRPRADACHARQRKASTARTPPRRWRGLRMRPLRAEPRPRTGLP